MLRQWDRIGSVSDQVMVIRVLSSGLTMAAFFSISGVIPEEDAIRYMKDAATHSYAKKGEAVVAMNHAGIDAGAKEYQQYIHKHECRDA